MEANGTAAAAAVAPPPPAEPPAAAAAPAQVAVGGEAAAAGAAGGEVSMLALLCDGPDAAAANGGAAPGAAAPAGSDPLSLQKQQEQHALQAALANPNPGGPALHALLASMQQQQGQQQPAAAGGAPPPGPLADLQQLPARSGGAQKPSRKKPAELSGDDDDWQPGKKPPSKRAKQQGSRGASGTPDPQIAALLAAGAVPLPLPLPGGVGASGAVPLAAFDPQYMAAMMGAGIPGFGPGGALNMQTLPAAAMAGAFPGATTAVDPQQQLLMQQLLMQQQLAGGRGGLVPLGAAPLTFSGAFGGAAMGLGGGGGSSGGVARSRSRGSLMMQQPPQPESAHEADELLSKCEQVRGRGGDALGVGVGGAGCWVGGAVVLSEGDGRGCRIEL